MNWIEFCLPYSELIKQDWDDREEPTFLTKEFNFEKSQQKVSPDDKFQQEKKAFAVVGIDWGKAMNQSDYIREIHDSIVSAFPESERRNFKERQIQCFLNDISSAENIQVLLESTAKGRTEYRVVILYEEGE